MPQFLTLVPRLEALANFLGNLPKPEPKSERVRTIDAAGRILLQDVVSTESSPAFSRSTVDGYAVIASDTFGANDSLPVYAAMIGEVPMGSSPTFSIRSGSTCIIHTGGMLPEGADAVVMLEDTQVARPNEIEILKSVAVGDNIISAGEDVQPGDIVLKTGRRIGPAEIGGLLALGILEIPTARPALVGILSSGDEVIAPECKPEAGQIRDINSYSLGALVQRGGGQARLYGIVPDDIDIFVRTLKKAFEECDMLIVTAGSSASTRDLTSTVIQQLGSPGVLVHGVRVRPGKPTILAVCEGKPVIGLPGNPVSALVIASLFAIPALDHIMGRNPAAPVPMLNAELTLNVPSVAGREDFIPVHLHQTSAGYQAEPVFFKSNMIFALAQADGLMHIPADAVGISAGEIVDILLPFS